MYSNPAPGQVLLGKYRVERVIGRGGMGVVVAATHLGLRKRVAIKFLLPNALDVSEANERFLREARAVARLKGEHVVQVQDVGALPDGGLYMVMEHLEGTDLKQLVRTRGPLPVQEALTYVLQACEALAEAHALGIIHRDLKLSNMFLTSRPNGTPCLKVLDFGVAKQLPTAHSVDDTLTQTGVMLGSPAYMAPEQITRSKEADPRSDIWSLGVVLYQLLTARLPFQSDAMTEMLGQVLQTDPVPPTHHRPDLPHDLDLVVMTCLQKPRENRFQTTLELTEALRSVFNGERPILPKRQNDTPDTPHHAGNEGQSNYIALTRSIQPAVAALGQIEPSIHRPLRSPATHFDGQAGSVHVAETEETWGTGDGRSQSHARSKAYYATPLAVLLAGVGIVALTLEPWQTPQSAHDSISPSSASESNNTAFEPAVAGTVSGSTSTSPVQSSTSAPSTIGSRASLQASTEVPSATAAKAAAPPPPKPASSASNTSAPARSPTPSSTPASTILPSTPLPASGPPVPTGKKPTMF